MTAVSNYRRAGCPGGTYFFAVALLRRRGNDRRRRERGVWQRRFWEHLIRDEADYHAHMDYVHINPLKHGLVRRVGDWPYSTFHRRVARGV